MAVCFPKRLLGRPLVGDVRMGTEPACDMARRIANRKGAGQEPAVIAGVRSKRERIFPSFAGFKAPAMFATTRSA